jgi:transcriptional regulator with XRE-family HTH domain
LFYFHDSEARKDLTPHKMSTSSTSRTKNARNLRRRQFAATGSYGVRSVSLLMGQLQEAEIRARIKAARKEAGLSQSKLAELLGVIPRTVQNYENDHVPWNRIRDIADITGKSTKWLLHGDASPDLDGSIDERIDLLEERLTAAIAELGVRIDEAVEAAALLTEQDREALRSLDAIQARLGRDQVGRGETRSRTARASRKAAPPHAA